MTSKKLEGVLAVCASYTVTVHRVQPTVEIDYNFRVKPKVTVQDHFTVT